MERKIGEKFNWRGHALEVVKDISESRCSECFFYKRSAFFCWQYDCDISENTYHTSVIFKEVDPQDTASCC